MAMQLIVHVGSTPIDSVPPHFRHTLWWVCAGVWSKCGDLPHLARTMAACKGLQPKLWQFNHTTCYLSGGFVVQVWWVCGPTLWWGCGGIVGLYPTTPTPHNCHTCPPTFHMLPSPTFYVYHMFRHPHTPHREHTTGSKYFMKYFKY